MPMIYVTVAGETFGIKTAKQEAMLHRMEKNYGPFMTADTVPAEKVLFIADIDRTVTVPAGEPLKTFDYALTEDAARLRIYPDRCPFHHAQGEQQDLLDSLSAPFRQSRRYPRISGRPHHARHRSSRTHP